MLLGQPWAAVALEGAASPERDIFVSQKTSTEVLQANAAHRVDVEVQQLAFPEFVSTKSRAQVAAETREAARLGLTQRNDFDRGYVSATAEQERLIAQAGERARSARTLGL